jgi:hypothetical protein
MQSFAAFDDPPHLFTLCDQYNASRIWPALTSDDAENSRERHAPNPPLTISAATMLLISSHKACV